MTRFGGNEFSGFSVPLVFEGRYFVLEPTTPPQLTVFSESEGEPVFEVLKNEPVVNDRTNVTKNAAGIITITDRATGRFLYKIRPGSDSSVVFGTLKGEEVDVTISDKEIRFGNSRIQNNRFQGAMAGVIVKPDGGFGVGCALPPAVCRLLSA